MKNFEKYKTAEERDKAFTIFCHSFTECDECTIGVEQCKKNRAEFVWLDLEAEEEKPLPCPFCGRECVFDTKTTSFKCTNCNYMSGGALMHESSIAAHNRVAKAVMESEAK